jgi:signal transduction histidine kinase
LDSSILIPATFNENNYVIHEINEAQALSTYDQYVDTSIYLSVTKDYEPVRMLNSAFALQGKYYQLKIISSMVEEDDLVSHLFWSIIWLYLILLICIILINNVVLRRLWRPFYSLLGQLQEFRIGKDEKLPTTQTQTDEFLQLKDASHTLIRHATETYRNQKQFTENASHELQTPLAIITNKLELLLENGTLNHKDADTVSQTLQIISRLTQLNKSLLLLSKIENRQFVEDQPISINNLIHEILEDLQEFVEFKQIKITLNDTQKVIVEMDQTLARVLVSNLIRNAIFHNKKQGNLCIEINHNTLTIQNTATAGPLVADDIFKRFYKQNRETQSVGLGLSIVHAICERYGFSIVYSFPGTHQFSIRFSQ